MRNFVAKYAKRTGAGVHTSKHGKKSPRCKQTNQFIKALKNGREGY